MITTILPFLTEVSVQLGETTTDVSTARITMANRSIRHTFEQYSWSFRRKELSLTTTVGVQEYDLTDIANVPDNDYDTQFGLYEVWNGTTRLDPILYERRGDYTNSDCFTLTPDNHSIVFSSSQTSATTYTIWYYARHVDVSSTGTTLKLSIPENFLVPVCTYIRHLVHDRKRQRNDARNMILDYQEQISDLQMSQVKSKARGLKRNITNPIQYTRYTRRYYF